VADTWAIQPHTEAKHEILSAYLKAWFPILSLGGFPRVIYVDGFAGPGRYLAGQEGSPLLALRALGIQALSLPSAFEFHFVEHKPAVVAKLESSLEALKQQGGVPGAAEIHLHKEMTFEEAYDSAIRDRLLKFPAAPAFALVDPFGWTGIPMRIISDLMRRASTEVMVNFMFEEINRFLAHPDQPNNFDALFGHSGWREACDMTGDLRKRFIHDLYRDQLRKSARYVRSFEMRNERGLVDYFLFFATNNFRGLEKMKEAMWRVDPDGGFVFSDATNPNQITMFAREPDRELLKRLITHQFGGQQATVGAVERFVVEDTPFLPSHYKKVLKGLEAEGFLAPINAPPTRRPGTYPNASQILRFRS
jgi:three-Cys-motif partner protein